MKLSLIPFANRPPVNNSGFNLIEVSIVMVIVALLLAGTLLPMGTMQESSKRHATADTIDEVVEALYGFAQVNSRLPCPATTTSNGAEAPLGGGVCTQQHGFVPSSTLGLDGAFNEDTLLSDAWLSPFRYSVSSANTSAVTTVLGMRDNGATADLRVCKDAACAGVIVDTAAAVVLSLGADWSTFDGGDVDATENSGEITTNGYRHGNDNDFVKSAYIEDRFDDQIRWLSPSILHTKLLLAGLDVWTESEVPHDPPASPACLQQIDVAASEATAGDNNDKDFWLDLVHIGTYDIELEAFNLSDSEEEEEIEFFWLDGNMIHDDDIDLPTGWRDFEEGSSSDRTVSAGTSPTLYMRMEDDDSGTINYTLILSYVDDDYCPDTTFNFTLSW